MKTTQAVVVVEPTTKARPEFSTISENDCEKYWIFRLVKLTPAELLLLGMVADGMSYKEVAGERGRSIQTIKNQARLILEKLQAKSITEAVAITMRHGLI